MWPKRKNKVDWMGYYNTLLEKKGESAQMGCLVLNAKTNETERVFYDHTKLDGLGCLVVGMRSYGFDLPEFPRIRLKQNPNFFQKFYLNLRFLYHEFKPVKPLTWKFKNPSGPYKTFSPYHHYFDEAQTELLNKKSAEMKIKLPTLILYALNRAVNDNLMLKPENSRWHIPVNMRGLYVGPTEDSNHISNFIVTLDSNDTPKDVFDKSSKELKSGSFLATFFMLNLGNYLGLGNLLKNKVDQDYKNPKCSNKMTGTFSTLGVWPPPSENIKHTDLIIFPHSNVSLKNPVCSVDVVWHGKLCFALAFHSSIVKNEEECKMVLKSMVNYLSEFINE
jgi:hypothetical protein